jgi:signal transduction histidine kinase
VNFNRTGIERRLDPAIELSLFRITQEALNNILRHAQATIGTIHLDFQPCAIALEIKDNGIGFRAPHSPAEFAPAGHFGLLGMYERTEVIGGKLFITSSDDGTIIRVDIKG